MFSRFTLGLFNLLCYSPFFHAECIYCYSEFYISLFCILESIYLHGHQIQQGIIRSYHNPFPLSFLTQNCFNVLQILSDSA